MSQAARRSYKQLHAVLMRLAQEGGEHAAKHRLQKEDSMSFWIGFEKRAYPIKDHERHLSKWQNVGHPDDEKNMAEVREAIHMHLRKNKHRLNAEGLEALAAHDKGAVGNYDAVWIPRFLKDAKK